MIGITVSTNYADLLPIVLEANLNYLDHWVFVTSAGDIKTIDILSPLKNVTVLFHDFNCHGARFDKGGGVYVAQQYAHRTFPSEWYLILDSDICLPDEMSQLPSLISQLDSQAIYGCKNRHDYMKLSDYRRRANFRPYPRFQHAMGFFQLYKRHDILYQPSINAAQCDDMFAKKFNKNLFFELTCHHLGGINAFNHNGRIEGIDFILD